MAMDKPISLFTVALLKQFTRIRRSTTAIGEQSSQESICHGGCSEKISRPKDYLRRQFTLGTDLESAKRKSWLRNHECPATNWAYSLVALTSLKVFWRVAAPLSISPSFVSGCLL